MSERLKRLERLRSGVVIPAHPLALNAERKLNERRQRALTRYYEAAGAGGIAVGVHTTQFAIRDREVGLLRPVLELAAETAGPELLKVAGVCGPTGQAVAEAGLATDLGYDLGLLSLAALSDASEDELIEHARQVGEAIPLFGFYLQPAVGGRHLSYTFWRRFAELPCVQAIKIAPFDRYRTLDVMRAVAASSRREEIALYTGNDDNILQDLYAEYSFGPVHEPRAVRMVGGLLGHWSVWTKRAVETLDVIHGFLDGDLDYLIDGAYTTDANAAFFDAAHGFRGCIAGIHEVLRRQGLLEGIWCLDPDEGLSPGQSDEIDRVYAAYPTLNDDDFVREHLDEWLG